MQEAEIYFITRCAISDFSATKKNIHTKFIHIFKESVYFALQRSVLRARRTSTNLLYKDLHVTLFTDLAYIYVFTEFNNWIYETGVITARI
jgi:hypothetical protein